MSEQDLGFYDSTRYRLVLSIVLGLFLCLFLVAFLPFGVSNYDPNHQYTLRFLAELSVFGWATIAFALVNELGIRPLVFRRATAKRVVLWSAWTCLFLSQGVFLTYNFVGGWHDFHFSSALAFVFQVSGVLIFPLTGTVFWFHHQGPPAEPTWYVRFADRNTLDNIHRKVWTATTAAAQSTPDDVVALSVEPMEGFNETQTSTAISYQVLQHFWKSDPAEVTRFARGSSLPSHGAAMVALYTM